MRAALENGDSSKDSADSRRHDYFRFFLASSCFFVSLCVNTCFPTGSIVSEVPESVNAADGAAVSH